MLKLRFNDGRQDPIWVVEKNFTIGSADDNSLVIDDASVSPLHAKLTHTRQTFVLKDLGSAQGTQVNGKTINQHAVACRDVLQFGDVEITIVDPAAEQLDYQWSLIACSNFLTGQEYPLRMNGNGNVIIGRGKRWPHPKPLPDSMDWTPRSRSSSSRIQKRSTRARFITTSWQ